MVRVIVKNFAEVLPYFTISFD